MIKYLHLFIIFCLTFPAQSYANSEIDSSKQLLTDYQSNNHGKFLSDFPANYKDFMSIFGFDNRNPNHKNLNEKSHELIKYFYTIKYQDPTNEISNKIFNIAKDAKWEADAVNDFQHELREKVTNNPVYLCELLKDRQDTDALKFSKFYFSGLYPPQSMPDELLTLQQSCPTTYEYMISGFINSLIKDNRTIVPENLVINDSDGNTNLRAGPSTTSKNIGTINNATYVRGLYRKGRWIFIQSPSNSIYGYISSKNARPVENLNKGSLPFIGSKVMGSPMGHMFSSIITIQLSANTTVMNCGEATAGNGCAIAYQGIYSNPLILDKKQQGGYYFKKNAIYDFLDGHVGEKLKFEDGDSW